MHARLRALTLFVGMLVAGASLLACAPRAHHGKRARAAAVWIGGDVHLADVLWNAELELDEPGFVNLEGAVGAAAPWAVVDSTERRVVLTHSEAAVRSLAPGVKLVGTANNHVHDGKEGVPAELLKDAGLIEVNGLVRTHGMQIVALSLDASDPNALDAVRDALAHVSASPRLLVAFHISGEQPSYLPGATLLSATDLAIEAGADLVVSHGTHLVGPIKRRGTAIVAFGLGNLMFNCECTDETDAIVLRWRADGSVEVVPVVAGLNGEPPRRATGERAQAIFDLLKAVGSDELEWVEDRVVFRPHGAA